MIILFLLEEYDDLDLENHMLLLMEIWKFPGVSLLEHGG